MIRLLTILTLALLSALPVGEGQAADCSVSAGPLNFTAVDTLGPGAKTIADITVTCSEVTAPQVAMCIEIGNSSTATSEQYYVMTRGESELEFGLYADNLGTTAWGGSATDGVGLPQAFNLPAGENGSINTSVEVYGIAPGSQPDTATGEYSVSIPIAAHYREGEGTDCGDLINQNPVIAELPVAGSVMANCKIEAHDIDFGTVGIIDKTLDANARLDVTCTPGAAYTITMGPGGYFDNGSRHMSSGSGMISYGLFHDRNGNLSWDDPFTETATGSDDQSVWGLVPPQPATPGRYTDTVTVTIDYQ